MEIRKLPKGIIFGMHTEGVTLRPTITGTYRFNLYIFFVIGGSVVGRFVRYTLPQRNLFIVR